MKETGKEICGKVMAICCFKMETNMKESGNRVCLTEQENMSKDNLLGNIMEIGKMAYKTVLEFKGLMTIHFTKESLSEDLDVGKANLKMKMVAFIKVNSRMDRWKVQDKSSLNNLFMKESLKKGKFRVRVIAHGSIKIIKRNFSILDNMKMGRRMVLDNIK